MAESNDRRQHRKATEQTQSIRSVESAEAIGRLDTTGLDQHLDQHPNQHLDQHPNQHLDQHEVWIVTDVPFWKLRNGSHQRIWQLCRALHRAKFNVFLWFIGDARSDEAAQRLVEIGVTRLGGPSSPPSGWTQRGLWHVVGTAAAAKSWLMPTETREELDNPVPQSLQDFRVKEIEKRLIADLRTSSPLAILFEYISLTYLAEAVRRDFHPHPPLIIDTHDVMHQRCIRFEQAKLKNWLQISAAEEAAALEQFDIILAIQADEAETFRNLVPNRQVVVCGHACDVAEATDLLPAHGSQPAAPDSQGADCVKIGLLSGAGDANRQSLDRFLAKVWPDVRSNAERPIQFHIAGGICAALPVHQPLPPGVVLVGRVNDLAEWYRDKSIIVNPIQVGTGLKIKSVEAMAHGCCLVTTSSGIEGLGEEAESASIVVTSDGEMANAIRELCYDQERRQAISDCAIRYIRKNHHSDEVFRELVQAISPEIIGG